MSIVFDRRWNQRDAKLTTAAVKAREHKETLSSPENDEESRSVDLRNDGNPLQLTGADDRAGQLIALVGEHQAAGRHLTDVGTIDLHCPLEQIQAVMERAYQSPPRVIDRLRQLNIP